MAMLSHRQSLSSALMFFAFPFVFSAGPNADPVVTYRAGASEVRITFFATDESNRPLETVSKDDFAVVDDGLVIRDFRSLTRSEETALDVLVMVDSSESVGSSFHDTMGRVLQLISQESLAGGDRISVVTFAGMRPTLVCGHDCQSPAARERLLAVNSGGSTPLFDALAYAARYLSGRRVRGDRPVLILFSDGNDTISMNSAGGALKAVIESGVLLYTIDLSKTEEASTGHFTLQRMAEATGGRSFTSTDSTVSVLQAVLTDLRNSYVVTYPLPNQAAGFHSLRILPQHNLNLRFHCRSGYYYE